MKIKWCKNEINEFALAEIFQAHCLPYEDAADVDTCHMIAIPPSITCLAVEC